MRSRNARPEHRCWVQGSQQVYLAPLREATVGDDEGVELHVSPPPLYLLT